MPKVLLSLIYLFVISSLSASDEITNSYYQISIDSNQIWVNAKLPLTIKNELIDFDESLVNAESQESFVNVLNDYVAQRFIFYSERDSSVLLNIQQSNSMILDVAEFEFQFELEGEVKGFRNELMLNVYPKQNNIHSFSNISNFSSDSLIKTSRLNPVVFFDGESSEEQAMTYKEILSGLIVLTLVLLFLYRRKS